MNKKIDATIRELVAISRMVEHVTEHLSALGVNDAELNRQLVSVQRKILEYSLHQRVSGFSGQQKTQTTLPDAPAIVGVV